MAKKIAKSKPKKSAPKRNRVSNQPRMDRKFEIEHAADTLMRAAEVKQNPKLMSDAKKELVSRQKALIKVIKGKA